MGPQSVPALVSVVLVEETGVRCAGRLASVPVDLDEQVLSPNYTFPNREPNELRIVSRGESG